MNHTSIIGNITKDIELKQYADGKSYARFTVAVNEGTKDKPVTQFIPCVAWGKTADSLSKYAGKGSKVAVIGSISVSTYEWEGRTRTNVAVNARRVEFLSTVKKTKDSVPEIIEDDEENPF